MLAYIQLTRGLIYLDNRHRLTFSEEVIVISRKNVCWDVNVEQHLNKKKYTSCPAIINFNIYIVHSINIIILTF